jgi:phosphate transport system permease protein
MMAAEGGSVLAAAILALFVVRFTGYEGKLAIAAIFLVLATTFTAANEGRQRGWEAAKNAGARAIVIACAVIVLVPLLSIMWTVVDNGRHALRPNFFTKDMSIASGDSPFDEGGALHAIIGTAQLVMMSSVVSIPLGILAALYLTEIRGRLSPIIRFLTQAMSGVPSVVAGLFVYSAWILGPGKAYSGIAGAMALSILMLPTVARTAEEVLKLVPDHLREAGQALGGTQWRTVAGIVLPTARSGLVTSGILGVARISGETAPLLLTIFGASAVNLSVNNGPISALPVFVFTHLKLGTDNAVARAWTGALVLMVLVLVLFSVARWFGGRKSR